MEGVEGIRAKDMEDMEDMEDIEYGGQVDLWPHHPPALHSHSLAFGPCLDLRLIPDADADPHKNVKGARTLQSILQPPYPNLAYPPTRHPSRRRRPALSLTGSARVQAHRPRRRRCVPLPSLVRPIRPHTYSQPSASRV